MYTNLTCSQIEKLLRERKDKIDGHSIQDEPAETPLERGLKSTGLTQEKIADRVGVHSSSISRYKKHSGTGKRRPSFKTLKKLASTTGKSPEQLFPELD
ncbi:MAG: helix-turn-helix domain-containing protein [Candidatus Lokiarchaeota archaeon]|nr:helix-turn-helix domain-containing protein [Candidatus Lokiarchaeota archaeon]